MKRILVPILAVACLAVPASALGATLQVDPGGTDDPTCGPTASACKTIGQAVTNAQPGDTVSVAAGNYPEQVTITKPLTLSGAGPSTVIGGVAHPLAQNCGTANHGGGTYDEEALVCANGVSGGSVTIENLKLDASGPGSDNDCTDDVHGIYVHNTAVSVSGVDIEHATEQPASLRGCQTGEGIAVINDDPTARTASITNSTVNDYAKTGIRLKGAGLSFTVNGNTITDQPSALVGSNGLQVGGTDGGTISGNTISGNECDETSGGCNSSDPINGVWSFGVLLYDNGSTTVSNNTVSGGDAGINVENSTEANSTTNVTGNTLTNNRYNGLFVGAGTTNASGNTITGSNIGVEDASYSGDPGDAIANLTNNTISHDTTGIQIDSQSGATTNPVLTAHGNGVTNDGTGIRNNTNQPVDATNNEFTCTAGSGSACVSGSNVNATEGTLKVTSAASQIATGASTTISAEFVDGSGNVIPVPDGTQIGFATSLGTIASSAPTSQGVATATLQGGSTPGTATVAAGAGDQAATTQVNVGTISTVPRVATTTTTTTTATATATLTKTGTTQTSTTTRTVAAPIKLFGPLLLSTRTIRASHGKVNLLVVNPNHQGITITVALTTRRHGRTVALAHRTVTLRGLAHGSVVLSLSRSAQALLKQAKSLKVSSTATSGHLRGATSFTLTR